MADYGIVIGGHGTATGRKRQSRQVLGRLLGPAMCIALGLMALTIVAATANNDNGSDVEHGFVCSVAIGGVSGTTGDVLIRWKGDTSYLMCKFKGLDLQSWDGVKRVEKEDACGIAGNLDSPGQTLVIADVTWRVNAKGNGTMRCVGAHPS